MLKNEEGIWVEDEGQLKFMVNDFYHKLFEDPSNNNFGIRPCILTLL
jgi:hypothetical protein